jgi:hypothetical protein
MEHLLTPADMAKMMSIREERVHEFRRRHAWPCVRVSRKEVRFTVEQVREIIERHTQQPEPPRTPPSQGQTRLSAER